MEGGWPRGGENGEGDASGAKKGEGGKGKVPGQGEGRQKKTTVPKKGEKRGLSKSQKGEDHLLGEGVWCRENKKKPQAARQHKQGAGHA